MEFQFESKHLKKYPHFDQIVSADELLSIVTDPDRVATNAFLPFLQYTKGYRPFRDHGNKAKKKERLIRFASRRDSAIYTYYRHILAAQYENRLSNLRIAEVPTAYRKIPLGDGSDSGKCNIDFANDLIKSIQMYPKCTVIALDIRQYFESIGHQRLYQVWCDLLGVTKLPADHLAVFKAITRYCYVDRSLAYERLGYIGPREHPSGITVPGYLVPYRKMPKQLCSPAEFRSKIAGDDPEFDSLICKNNKSHGIPQGAPLSDLLANAYLLDFDIELSKFARENSGQYWRYSDDLVLVLPGTGNVGGNAAAYVEELIQSYGEALKIKSSKTCIGEFVRPSNGNVRYQHVGGDGALDGIQYLGFRFDGERVFMRNSTMSNFYRKITKRARREAKRHVARYSGKDKPWLLEKFDFNAFEDRFGRVRDFESVASPKGWTFWTYARRAAERFGQIGSPVLKQVAGYRGYVRRAVSDEIDRQLDMQNARNSD